MRNLSESAARKQREAQKKWHKEHLDKLSICVPKGWRDRYNDLAKKRGISLSSIVSNYLKLEYIKEKLKMKVIGKWWNSTSIDMVEVDGTVYALDGWNGEEYCNCWICSGEHFMDASKESYTLRPVWAKINEDDFDVVDFDVNKN